MHLRDLAFQSKNRLTEKHKMSQSQSDAIEQRTVPRFTISPATENDLADVIKLFTLYAESLHIDLSFQSFTEELANLPGKYAPPTGQILLARREVTEPESLRSQRDSGRGIVDEINDPSSRERVAALTTVANGINGINGLIIPESIGCVAVRPISFSPPFDRGGPDVKRCEMKRLYTLPSTRGQGVGRELVREILDVAQELGYDEMYLDTLSTMTAALRMYEKYGFVRTEAYYHNPNEGVVFLVKKFGAV
ncbi:hypothetical protein TWF694_003043 [Orbilia ellipsospora]|uniref:N-acetyltransferase domain-containing protein n=1 Tax=Orbilia ellipsospora TaxID=2528407 RepID=A0AAV9X6G9_9PEZI